MVFKLITGLYNQDPTGKPGRGEEYVLMVPSSSALLDIAEETSKSVAYNHFDMAKIVSPTDEPYPTIKDKF